MADALKKAGIGAAAVDTPTLLAALAVLAEQAPKIHQRLEGSMKVISERFVSLAEQVEKMESNAADAQRVRALAARAQDDISTIILNMQFQDWVSQNLEVFCTLLTDVGEYLAPHAGQSLKDKALIEFLLSRFKMGEFQHAFLYNLVQSHVIASAEELGRSLPAEKQDPEDNIDLF